MNGFLLVDKEPHITSFALVSLLRKVTHIETIGHAGTLDPFATGVMVMLIGREFTKKADEYLHSDKQYKAKLQLGVATDTYDLDGKPTRRSDYVPTLKEVELALVSFQGEILQVPPMYSAKKIKGKKLYELARKGHVIERQPSLVRMKIALLEYSYPYLEIQVDCSKGTYIRSLAEDLGQALHSGAHLVALCRTKAGPFALGECLPSPRLREEGFNIRDYLRQN